MRATAGSHLATEALKCSQNLILTECKNRIMEGLDDLSCMPVFDKQRTSN